MIQGFDPSDPSNIRVNNELVILALWRRHFHSEARRPPNGLQAALMDPYSQKALSTRSNRLPCQHLLRTSLR